MGKKLDTETLDLFEIPEPVECQTGTMDFNVELRHLVTKMIKLSPLDRYEIACQLSRLTGLEISKNQLDSWTAESRQQWHFPMHIAPVLEEVCESYLLTQWFAKKRGGRVLFGREVLVAELGKLERDKENNARRIKDLKKVMGEDE